MFQNGSGDAQIHSADLHFLIAEFLETVNRRLVVGQDLLARQKSDGIRESAVCSGKLGRPLGFAELRVPT